MRDLSEPHQIHYNDPVESIILSIPVLSRDTKSRLRKTWISNRPGFVTDAVRWYGRHDDTVILSLRALVTILPIVLIRVGFDLGIVIFTVVLGIYLTEFLGRKRDNIEQQRTIEETIREYSQREERYLRRESSSIHHHSPD